MRLSAPEKMRYQTQFAFVFGSFKEWAKEKGVELLRDDLFFLASEISTIDGLREQKIVARDYVMVWKKSMIAGSQNAGRKAANVWLLNRVF